MYAINGFVEKNEALMMMVVLELLQNRICLNAYYSYLDTYLAKIILLSFPDSEVGKLVDFFLPSCSQCTPSIPWIEWYPQQPTNFNEVKRGKSNQSI